MFPSAEQERESALFPGLPRGLSEEMWEKASGTELWMLMVTLGPQPL